MGKARFTAVLLGLETPVARLLKSSGKGISVEQTMKTIRMLHAQDIGAWGTFTLFSQQTNLQRLRRTMFGVFWSWIWFLVKEQARSWLGLGRKSSRPHRRASAQTK